jgi:hypothetical protein
MKKSLFSIDESEKQRILEMHQSATQKQYLGEQAAPATTTAPVTAPGPKDPAAFVKSVSSIVVGNDPKNQLVFKSPTSPNGITFTTQVTKVPDQKDARTGQVIPGVYTIMLLSDKMNIRFTFTCGGGAKFESVNISDPNILTQNPLANNKSYKGNEEISRLLSQLVTQNGDFLNTTNNPFLAEFKQQYCS